MAELVLTSPFWPIFPCLSCQEVSQRLCRESGWLTEEIGPCLCGLRGCCFSLALNFKVVAVPPAGSNKVSSFIKERKVTGTYAGENRETHNQGGILRTPEESLRTVFVRGPFPEMRGSLNPEHNCLALSQIKRMCAQLKKRAMSSEPETVLETHCTTDKLCADRHPSAWLNPVLISQSSFFFLEPSATINTVNYFTGWFSF